MRKFASIFTLLMLFSALAIGQTRTVTGLVTDDKGDAVPFATITETGTKNAVKADVAGLFSIKIKSGSQLTISASGLKNQTITPGSGLNNIAMVTDVGELKEVVVTSAFSTKRTARSTTANTQNVNSEQLNTIRQLNVNNALAGKVAGLQVRSQSSAKLGAETLVKLRGENGIGIGGGALYVVDGTIMPSSQDINPDDIEDITVLQGPSAAALFGPDGLNGAIVVNTKKAKKSAKGIGIEVNSGISFDMVYIQPDYQNEYGGGTDPDFKLYRWKSGDPVGWQALDGKYYHDYTEDVSWGPRLSGQEYIPWYAWYGGHKRAYQTARWLPEPNNARDYFKTGSTKLNNVSFSKAGEGYNVRVSYTKLDQSGLIPTSWLKKNTLNLNASMDLGPRFVLSTSLNYIGQKRNAENNDAYSNNTSGSFNQWFHRQLDINILKELRALRGPNGELATWNHNNPDAYSSGTFYKAYYWFSPYSWQDNVYNFSNRDRLFGDIGLTYKVNKDLKLKFTYRKQQLTTNTDTRQYNALDLTAGTNSGFSYWEAANGRSRPWGGYEVGYSQSNRQNFEFLASFNKKIKDFQIGVNAGLDLLKTDLSTTRTNTLGGLFVPDKFILSNAKNGLNTVPNVQKSKRRSLFATTSIGFRNYLFADATYRRDYISTEAPPDFYIDTKSFGLSFIFSEFINKNRQTFLSYGKIRGSFGNVLNSLGIYQNNVVYAIGTQTFSGNLLMAEPNEIIDPLLQGAVNDEKEIGIELRFLKNRIGIAATYWDRTNKDFPLDAVVSSYTGYGQVTTNAGEVEKTGIDIQLFADPVKSKNFDWNILATFGKLLKNDVIAINPALNITAQNTQTGGNGNVTLVSQVGSRWGQLRGTGIKRNADGVPMIRPDGTYEKEENVLFGSSLPLYTGGLQNSLTLFKDFIIKLNIDYSHGGKFFSLSDYYGSATGLYKNSVGLNDKGYYVRDPVDDGGGIRVRGVAADGRTPVDMYVDARHFYEINGLLGQGIAETAIRDLSFVKLREVSLGYRIPVEKLGLGKYLTNAVFSVTSRNPWLIYVNGKGFDPSELTNESGENGQLPGTRSIGFNLKLGF